MSMNRLRVCFSGRRSSSAAFTLVALALAPMALATQGCKKDPATGGTGGTTTTTTTSTSTTSAAGGGGGGATGGGGGAGGGDSACAFVSGGDPSADDTGDFCDSISSNTPTYVCDCIDVISVTATLDDCSTTQADALFNAAGAPHGCESKDHDPSLYAVCGANLLGMPAGGLVVVSTEFAAPIPLADPDHSYIYSLVFDSDGQPANNWKFNPPYDWDLFQGADRWYQLIWDHVAQAWTVRVTQVNDQQQTSDVPSSARAEIWDAKTITWYVSESEVPGPNAAYRSTAFGHDGNFSATDRGADVSGADPTVPLTPLPQ